MKRIFIGLIAMLIVAAGLITVLPFFLSSDSVRNGILAHITELTGRQVTFRGNPNVSFQPFLGIEISDVIIADPYASPEAPPLLNVERVKAQLDILPALIGNVVITQYQLVRPRINLKVYSDGNTNWKFDKGTVGQALEASAQNNSSEQTALPQEVELGQFTIKDGILIYEDEIAGSSETLTNINGRLSWQAINQPLNIAGNAIWRGEGITTNITVSEPLGLLSGSSSPASMDFNSQALTFDFTGQANMLSDLFIKGSLKANTPSIGRLSEILTVDIGRFNNFENWQAEGELEATANNINLSDAQITIGENQASGVVSLATNEVGKSKLDGTLAFDAIDVSAYFSGSDQSGQGDFSPATAKGMDVDLRISSNTINTGLVTLENVAAAITMKEGNWTFDIGDSTALGGHIIAKLGERIEDESRQAFLEITASEIDAQSITDLIGKKLIGVTGKTTFNASLRTKSLDEGFFTRGLNGSVESQFSEGAILGIDLSRLLRAQSQSNPDTGYGFEEADKTDFKDMTIKFFLNNGIAALSKSIIKADGISIQLFGDADLHKGNLALQAQEISDEGLEEKRLFIGGTIVDPLVSLQRGPQKPTKTETENEVIEEISN